MLRVDLEKWGQDPEDIRYMAQQATHPRTRERLMALYEVTQGKNASQVARQFGRENETVHNWIRQYDQGGPNALLFKRSGGRPPFARRSNKRWVTS
jgi:transposase